MQLSNGLSNPAGLWLGHLMFDSVISVIGVTIITIVFAATTHNQFHGLGLFVSVFIHDPEQFSEVVIVVACHGFVWCCGHTLRLLHHVDREQPSGCVRCHSGSSSFVLHCEFLYCPQRRTLNTSAALHRSLLHSPHVCGYGECRLPAHCHPSVLLTHSKLPFAERLSQTSPCPWFLPWAAS
jgi:hypothetical protein